MSAPLLEVENLVRHFVVARSLFGRALATVRAVDGVSFQVQPGETLALVGKSGCGKSTVGRLVLRLIEPTAGGVVFAGRDHRNPWRAGDADASSQCAAVFQDPYASLNPRMTVGDILAEPLALHAIVPREGRQKRVAELLDMVGLASTLARRYPHEFSGGQRQRIAIARALAVEPKLIVCDEPVSALDVSDQRAGAQLTAGPAATIGTRLHFHLPRSCSGQAHCDPRGGDELGSHRRDRDSGNSCLPSHATLIAARCSRRSRCRKCAPSANVGAARRHAERAQSASRVPFPHTLPVRDRPLPQLAAASDRRQGGHATACHIWPELPRAKVAVAKAAPSPVLERLIAAFGGIEGRAGFLSCLMQSVALTGDRAAPETRGTSMKTISVRGGRRVRLVFVRRRAAQTTFKIGLAEDPDILDPTLARTYVGRIVFASICDKLFDIDEKLNIVPQLALSTRPRPTAKP